MEFDHLLPQVLDIIWGVMPLLEPDNNMTVYTKSQGNFATSVDFSAEEYLIQRLTQLLPAAGVISEESEPVCRELNWMIDPVDGTGNMLSGFPYAVSAALANLEGDPLLGVVLDVCRNRVFYALPGKGAFVQKRGESPVRIHVKKTPPAEGICIFGMPYNRNKAHSILSIAERLYTISSDLKRIGPSSLDICSVAEGRAKMYVELDLNNWDYKAGELILKEAGGFVGKDQDLMAFCAGEDVWEQVKACIGVRFC